jgi:tetratricopeptide (TPR) repeat protein
VKPPEPAVVKPPEPEPVKPHVPTEEEKMAEQQRINDELIKKAEEFIKAGDLNKAQETLAQCKMLGKPCPEAKSKQDLIKAERGYKVLLDRAEKAIAAKNTSEATNLLGQAYNTQVYIERHKELEEKLRVLMAKPEPVAVKAPEPVKPEKKPDPPPAPVASKNAAETDKLIEDARELNKKSEYAAAKTKLTKCIALDANNATCHKLLGIVYANLKDNKKGVFHYKKFIELAPDDPAVPKVKAIIEAYEATQK